MNLLNFERYLLVTTLVMAAAMLLARLSPIPAAKVRLRFLYLTLLICLLAPLCFMQQERIGAPSMTVQTNLMSLPVFQLNAAMPTSLWRTLYNRIGTGPLIVLAIGFLRILWLCAGLIRLSLYRLRAQPIMPLPDHLRTLRDRQRVDASLFVSNEVRGPVTFGLISSTILLPADFDQLDHPGQSAIVCHELVHVRRNDAVTVFCEEVFRSLLWFHPCVWWLLDRIQLCREQVVDAETIALTEDREAYLETLLAFAQRTSIPDLAPATPFLKKHHLLERVKSIASEVHSTSFTARANAFVLCTAVPCLLALAIWRLPLQAAPQLVPDTPGVTVSSPYDIQHRGPVELPFDVVSKGIAGEVVVTVTLSTSGEVTEARLVRGPSELATGVLRSIKGWHFSSASSIPHEFNVVVAFDPASDTRSTVQGTPATITLLGWDRPLTIRKLDVSALPEPLQKEVLAHLTVKAGDVVNAKSPSELAALVSANVPRVQLRLKNVEGNVEVTYLYAQEVSSGPPPESGIFQVASIDASGVDDATRQRVIQSLGLSVGSTLTLDEFTRKSTVVFGDTVAVLYLTGQPNKPDSNLVQVALRITRRPNSQQSSTLTRIDASELPEPLRQQVLDRFGLHPGDLVTREQINEEMVKVRAIDQHVVLNRFYSGPEGKLEIHFLIDPDAPVEGVVGGVPGGMRGGVISGVPSGPRLLPVYMVPPVYPPLARQARVQGTVRFSVIVSPDGNVQNLQLISGHPLLVPAATEAAKQWRFPASPSAAKTTIDVDFVLQ